MKRISWALQTAVFYLVTLAFAAIPEALIRSAGRFVGGIMFRVLSGRRNIAIDNIRQVLPYMQQSPEWECSLQSAE